MIANNVCQICNKQTTNYPVDYIQVDVICSECADKIRQLIELLPELKKVKK